MNLWDEAEGKANVGSSITSAFRDPQWNDQWYLVSLIFGSFLGPLLVHFWFIFSSILTAKLIFSKARQVSAAPNQNKQKSPIFCIF